MATPTLMVLVDGVFDKVPQSPWKGKNAYISRGPSSGIPDNADCIFGHEITLQLDIWSRKPDHGSMDDMVYAVTKAVNDVPDLSLNEYCLVDLRVVLTRIIDDPDPLTVHGIVQLTALIDEPV